ncbi:hypothetical protein, partial [Xanthomonas oryzae]|uniref:hypothetical protein n=1 Tax=Xanthomonas oryzae TaxID=347 RepID=UPI00215D05D3
MLCACVKSILNRQNPPNHPTHHAHQLAHAGKPSRTALDHHRLEPELPAQAGLAPGGLLQHSAGGFGQSTDQPDHPAGHVDPFAPHLVLLGLHQFAVRQIQRDRRQDRLHHRHLHFQTGQLAHRFLHHVIELVGAQRLGHAGLQRRTAAAFQLRDLGLVHQHHRPERIALGRVHHRPQR